MNNKFNYIFLKFFFSIPSFLFCTYIISKYRTEELCYISDITFNVAATKGEIAVGVTVEFHFSFVM